MIAKTQEAPPAPAAEEIVDPTLAANRQMDEWMDSYVATTPEGALVATPEAQIAPETRTQKVETAMQLTTQAVQAWLSVLNAPSIALDSSAEKTNR